MTGHMRVLCGLLRLLTGQAGRHQMGQRICDAFLSEKGRLI